MAINIKNSQKTKRLNQRKIKKDLGRALSLLKFEKAELSIVFVGDPAMKRLNGRYRGIEKTTDVLSFPMREGEQFTGPVVLGDIVISIPQAMRQALEYGNGFYGELLRLLVHGLLHLLGYDHEKGAYLKRKMVKKEKELLHALTAVD